MQIKALHNNVVIRRNKAADVTPQGVALPDTGKERPVRGTIVAVGPGRVSELTGQLVPTETTVGQRVLFPQFAGSAVPGMPDVLVMSERDLLLVLDEGEEVG